MPVIDLVKANQHAEQPQVAFHELFAEQEGRLGEADRHPVEREEHVAHGGFIHRLIGGETGAVDPAFEVVVQELVERLLVRRKVLRKEVRSFRIRDARPNPSVGSQQRARHQGPVGPGASQRHVEMAAALLRRRIIGFADRVAERIVLSFENTGARFGRHHDEEGFLHPSCQRARRCPR